MSTLETLQLQLTTHLSDDGFMGDYFDRRHQGLNMWLKSASRLRTLRLSMPDSGDELSVQIEEIIKDTTWPELQELSLSGFDTTEGELVDLLLCHKRTLRLLSLSCIYLHHGTRSRTWTRLAGTLPELRHVRLCGEFSEYTDSEGFLCPGGDDQCSQRPRRRHYTQRR